MFPWGTEICGAFQLVEISQESQGVSESLETRAPVESVQPVEFQKKQEVRQKTISEFSGLEYLSLELPDSVNLEIGEDEISWQEQEENEDEEEEPVPQIHSAKDYWSKYGVSDSVRESFQDGVPWGEPETSALLRFQYLMQDFPLDWLAAWSHKGEEVQNFGKLSKEERDARRFEIYRIQGTFRNLKEVTYPSEISLRFSIKKYWIVSVDLKNGGEGVIFCTKIPRILQKGGVQNASVAAYALIMKEGEPSPFQRVYLLADRLEYFPDNFLGKQGMDFGLFDDLDREELGPKETRSRIQDLRLSTHNRECFYQLMNTVSRISPEEMRAFCKKTLAQSPAERLTEDGRYSSPFPLFLRPVDERGNFFYLCGTAKKIEAVRVEDEDIRTRFGITHFYQIFLFTQDSQENPILVLTTKLPEGIEPGRGDEYRADMAVPAFFFNTWGYSSTDAQGKPVTRLTPLLMGGIPEVLPTPEPIRAFWVEMILLLIMMGGLFSLAIYLFCVERREKVLRKEFLTRGELPEGEIFDESKINTTGYVDFRTWAENASEDGQKKE